jgi:hypothetical protein
VGRYAPIPIGRVMAAVKAILQADMPAYLYQESLPGISSWTFSDVLVNEENQLPQVCVDVKWKRRPASIGGGFRPLYGVDIICAMEWVGNQENYMNGAAIAAIAEGVMFENVQYADEDGTLWNAIINGTVQGTAVGEAGVWQGGHSQFLMEGAPLYYG